MGVFFKVINMIYFIISFFALFILFSKPVIAQDDNQSFNCFESTIFKVFEDMNTLYENNKHNNYSFNLDDTHIIFFGGSPGTANYIKLPISSRNGEYLKATKESVNVGIQFGPTQKYNQSKRVYYLKSIRNSITHSELSYSECLTIN